MYKSSSHDVGMLVKLLAAYAAVMLGVFVFVGLPLHIVFRRDYISNAAYYFKSSVRELEPELISAIAADDRQALDKLCDRINQNFMGRIAIFSPEGEIIGESIGFYTMTSPDTDHPPLQTQSHNGDDADLLGLPDKFTIQTALLLDDQSQVVVSLALPLWPLHAQTRKAQMILLLGTAGSFAVAFLAGLVLSRRLAQPLSKMTRLAESIAAGDFSDNLTPMGGKYVTGRLGDAIEKMRVNLRDYVTIVRDERNKLQAILYNMTEGVLAVGSDGRIIFFNRAFGEMLDAKGSLNSGINYEEVDLRPEIMECVRSVRRTGAPYFMDSGDIIVNDRAIALTADPVHLSDSDTLGACGVVVVAHDITHAKRIETMGRELVANASHEMRTPLASMSSAVETLIASGEINDPQILEILNIIFRQTGRLKRMVDETLQMSRLDSMDEPLSPSPMDISYIIEESRDFFGEGIRRKGISLRFDAPDDIRQPEIDQGLFMLAIRNLIANAVKYSPEGGEILVRASNEGNDFVLEVADNGPGIDPTDQPRVFDRFFRAESNHDKEDGVGLGLTIVKKVAQFHGGDIDLESSPGKGCRFFFRIPVKT